MANESTAAPETTPEAVRGSLGEHAASERLVAQRGLLSGPSPLVSADVYVCVDRGIGYRDHNSLRLEEHAHATGGAGVGSPLDPDSWKSVSGERLIRVRPPGRV